MFLCVAYSKVKVKALCKSFKLFHTNLGYYVFTDLIVMQKQVWVRLHCSSEGP